METQGFASTQIKVPANPRTLKELSVFSNFTFVGAQPDKEMPR